MLKGQSRQRQARSTKQSGAPKPVHKPTKRNILTTRRKALKKQQQQQQQYESIQHKAFTRRAFSNKSETDSPASSEQQPFVTKQQYLQATATMSQQDKAHYEKLKLKAQQQLAEGPQEIVDEDEVPLNC
eukprot:UN02645